MVITLSICGADIQNAEIQNTDMNNFASGFMENTDGKDLESIAVSYTHLTLPTTSRV